MVHFEYIYNLSLICRKAKFWTYFSFKGKFTWYYNLFSVIYMLCYCRCSTVKPVLRDHCHGRQPVLKHHQFLAKVLHFNVKHGKWTCYQRPVSTDHIFYGQWGGLPRQVLLYTCQCVTHKHHTLSPHTCHLSSREDVTSSRSGMIWLRQRIKQII